MSAFNTTVFYIFGILMLLCTIIAIFAPRIVYSVLSAVCVFLCVAVMYFLLNSPFNAVAQIAIYAIAVALLLVFAIMLISYKNDTKIYLALKPRTILAALSLGVIVSSSYLLLCDDFNEFIVNFDYTSVSGLSNIIDTTKEIGMGIFQNYIIAFELLSIFLLIALIGVGVVLVNSRKEDK